MSLEKYLGNGRYVVGIRVSGRGAIVAIVQKFPELRGFEYVDVLELIAIEIIRDDAGATLDRLVALLSRAPIGGDHLAYLDVESAPGGDALLSTIKARGFDVPGLIVNGVRVVDQATSGRDANGNRIVTAPTLATIAHRLHAAQRLRFVDSLPNVGALERHVFDTSRLTGDDKEMAMATNIALWGAYESPSNGPCPSFKVPTDPAELAALRAHRLEQQHIEAERQKSRDRQDPFGFGGGGS